MAKDRLSLTLIAAIAAALGIATIFGVLLVDEVSAIHAVSAILSGVLLISGGWFLWLRCRVAIFLIWASTAVYAFVQLVPAIQQDGSGAFKALMSAFYISIAIRVGLAVAGQWLLRRSVNYD